MSLVESLRTAVAGDVLAPGSPEFADAVSVFNTTMVHQPAAAVIPQHAADVAAAIRVCATAGSHVAVQATGHAAAPATRSTVLINTRHLDSITIDPHGKTATVGAGVRWRDLTSLASKHGLAGLAGSAPDVGIVGYTLGGGLGPIARTFGFAADHVISLEVVGADGKLRTIDSTHEPELFWAIRGGGSAFGVVTEMTFRLFELPTIHAGGLYFDITDAKEIFHWWRRWISEAPECVSSSIAILNLPPKPTIPEPIRGKTVVHLRYANTDLANQSLAEPSLAIAAPILGGIGLMPYSDLGMIHAEPTDSKPTAERSILLSELPAEGIDAFLAIAGPSGELPIIIAEVRALGGAIGRTPEVPNAVGGRSAAFSVFALGLNTPPLTAALDAALESILEAMRPWASGGALVNFAGDVVGPPADRVAAAWPSDTYQRLDVARNMYDPNGVFDASARWPRRPA